MLYIKQVTFRKFVPLTKMRNKMRAITQRQNNPATTPVNIPVFSLTEAQRIFDSLDITPGTRADYQSRIHDFLKFAEGRGRIYQNILIDYKTELAGRLISAGGVVKPISTATKNKYLAAAKIYLSQLHRLFGFPDYSKFAKGFKQSKKHKKEGLNRSEMERLVNALHKLPKDIKGLRARALFTLLTFQGLRQIELRRLRVSDVDLKNEVAFIEGKGAEDREMIYLHGETVKALQNYITARGGSGYLFQSIGNRKSSGMISTMTLQREIKALFTVCGIEKTVHGFRHFYITQLLEKHDARTVRKFSRHKNLEMLIVYDDELDTRKKTADIFNTLSQAIIN